MRAERDDDLPGDQKLTCRACQREFLYSAFELGRFGRPYVPLCRECRLAEKDSPDTEHRECVICFAPFTVTPSARAFFISKGFELPRRCPSCRRDARERFHHGR